MRTLFVGLIFLSACQPAKAPEVDAPDTKASGIVGGVDLGSPARALGTEPFWSVAITPQELVYSGVDRPEARFANPGPRIDGDTAVIAAEGLAVTLKAATCSDGMSDRTYPLEAEVTAGAEVLKGCAESQAVLDAGPRP